MSLIHRAAQKGYSRAAATYEEGRPEYPEQLLPWLRDTLGARPGARVVDVGAGTGKFTRLLQRSGAAITAVEPVAAMRAALVTRSPEVTAVAGTADSTGLATGYADIVVCAQAFHWFATPAALAELCRILAPGGRLALIWNVRDNNEPWVADMSRLFEPYEVGTPRHHSGQWRRAIDQAVTDGAFGELREFVVAHAHEGAVDDVVIKRFLSVSFIAALPAAERTVIEQQLREMAATHPDLRGRERVVAPYRTHAYWCVRG